MHNLRATLTHSVEKSPIVCTSTMIEFELSASSCDVIPYASMLYLGGGDLAKIGGNRDIAEARISVSIC